MKSAMYLGPKNTRKKAKLQPHQYSLRLDNPNLPPKVVDPSWKPHIIFHDGMWCLYRNKYKSQFRFKPPWLAACIQGANITTLQFVLKRTYDKWSFGYYLRPSNRPR